MDQDRIKKIQKVYADSKVLAEKYEYSEVLLNDGAAQKDIMNEWARQINITNLYRQKEKDLQFVFTWLQEYRNGVSSVHKNAGIIKQLDLYMDNYKALLKVYFTIGQIQNSILKYYEKGGATY